MTALEARKNIAALKAGVLIRRERFWPRLCFASVVSGPLNPVGIIASLWFLQYNVQIMFVVLVAINFYCTVATLFAVVAISTSARPWTEKRLTHLGLSVMGWLCAATCFLGLLTGPAVIVFLSVGLILALVIGAPAAIFGTTLLQMIVFKRP